MITSLLPSRDATAELTLMALLIELRIRRPTYGTDRSYSELDNLS